MEEKHMHQTLYRKYRPTSLEDIYGQDVIVTILKNQLASDAVSHAYLFAGPRGTGKTSVAKNLAHLINCEGEKKPCGTCHFCSLRQEEHLDIIEIDAASNNGVEEIRELKRKVNLTPTNGKYKVYIVDEVHMLTSSAFNALLKTLEEPPSYVLFVLATTEIHKVPETILSRCQRLDFKRLTDQAIIDRLQDVKKKEKISIANEALAEIARLAQGSMRDAIGLLEQASAYKAGKKITVEDIHTINSSLSQKEIENLFFSIINGDFDNVLAKTNEYYKAGKNVTKVLEEIINFLRICLLDQKVLETDSAAIKQINQVVEYDLLLEETIGLNKFLLEMKYDSNPKTLLEIALINLANNIADSNNSSENEPVINLLGDDKESEKTTAQPPENKSTQTATTKNPTLKQVEKNKAEAKQTSTQSDEKVTKTNEKPTKKKQDVNKGSAADWEKLKRRRIDNTFAKVSKRFKEEIAGLIQEENVAFTKDHDYGHLLLDGEVKAASAENQYFIIAFESKASCELYNKNLTALEKLLEKQIKKSLKSIAITEQEWVEYRKEFKEKKREYKYQAEDNEIEPVKPTKNKFQNEIEKKYADLIQKY